MHWKYLTVMVVITFLLAPAAFGQMSAVDFNKSPDKATTGNNNPGNKAPWVDARSSNDVDYTINQPEVGTDPGSGESTTVIPEPATLILVGLGLAAAGIHRKFKRQ